MHLVPLARAVLPFLAVVAILVAAGPAPAAPVGSGRPTELSQRVLRVIGPLDQPKAIVVAAHRPPSPGTILTAAPGGALPLGLFAQVRGVSTRRARSRLRLAPASLWKAFPRLDVDARAILASPTTEGGSPLELAGDAGSEGPGCGAAALTGSFAGTAGAEVRLRRRRAHPARGRLIASLRGRTTVRVALPAGRTCATRLRGPAIAGAVRIAGVSVPVRGRLTGRLEARAVRALDAEAASDVSLAGGLRFQGAAHRIAHADIDGTARIAGEGSVTFKPRLSVRIGSGAGGLRATVAAGTAVGAAGGACSFEARSTVAAAADGVGGRTRRVPDATRVTRLTRCAAASPSGDGEPDGPAPNPSPTPVPTTTPPPPPAPDTERTLSLALGWTHTCALRVDGSVACWGLNDVGQLGYGDSEERLAPPTRKVDLGEGRTARSIGSMWYDTCALLDDGSVKCWGSNRYGQLGYGEPTGEGAFRSAPPSEPVAIGGLATALAVGASQTCVILVDGSVKCWGANTHGQLGYEPSSTVLQPVPLAKPVNLGPGRTARQIVAGDDHTCALLDDSSVECWGNAHQGQAGYGVTGRDIAPAPQRPIDLGAGRTARHLFAGAEMTCAVLDDGDTKCWGYNLHGQVGTGDKANRPSPTPIDFGGGRPTTIAGGYMHTCALRDDGRVTCWGRNDLGQLATGDTDPMGEETRLSPGASVALPGGARARAVFAGGNHACAVLEDGRISCWGHNRYGQLGYGDRISRVQAGPPLDLGG